MTVRGLLMIPNPGEGFREDFEIIGRHLGELDSDLRVRTVHDEDPPADLVDGFRGIPTLAVSFRHHVPVPVPGRLFCCRFVPKPQQLRAYLRDGLPFPRSRLFQWGMELDPTLWGPLVVMKPISPGTMSSGNVHLMRTGLVRHLRSENFAPDHPVHNGPMLVQAFVDTGERPSVYRALTLFGEPLYAQELRLKEPRPALSSPNNVLLAANVATNFGPREGRDRALVDDVDVLSFARRMARAFPDVPLQGQDILREHATGRLFALESNPGGNTWHFSRPGMMGVVARNGSQVVRRKHAPLKRAAEVLVAAARRYAA